MKAEYPNNEQQSSYQEMKKPYDKNSGSVTGTSIHPHSVVKPIQKLYHLDGSEADNARDVLMYGSDFKSSLPQHPNNEKYTNYVSEYKGRFPTNQDNALRTRTQS
ncbi:MAG: hypothetical protein KDD45_08685 [Bdellovibrionales bacterium]|nr:hypothetical protein [Bdellovibrionales bacterium]